MSNKEKTQIIKVPGINGLSNTKGTRNSGNAIIKQINTIINSKGKTINKQDFDIEEIHVDNNNLKQQQQLIYENSLKAYEENNKTIFLGGDHSISYSTIKAFFDYNSQQKKQSFIIIFDAHVDLMKPMQEPSHEEWLRAIIEKYSSKNILLVGARKIDKKEKTFFGKNKIRIISIEQFTADIQDTTEFIMESSQGRPLYISIDIDVIDPHSAPATHFREDHGLTSQQMLYIVKKLALMRNLKAIDIVEIDSESKQFSDKEKEKTIKLGAKILAEFL